MSNTNGDVPIEGTGTGEPQVTETTDTSTQSDGNPAWG